MSIFKGAGERFSEGFGSLDNEGTVWARGMREGRSDGRGGTSGDFEDFIGMGEA